MFEHYPKFFLFVPEYDPHKGKHTLIHSLLSVDVRLSLVLNYLPFKTLPAFQALHIG